MLLLATVFRLYPFLHKLYADSRYAGPQFQDGLRQITQQIKVESVKRSNRATGFMVLPKRWIVDRIVAWLNRCHRWLRVGSA